jgi:hypothetical protein
LSCQSRVKKNFDENTETVFTVRRARRRRRFAVRSAAFFRRKFPIFRFLRLPGSEEQQQRRKNCCQTNATAESGIKSFDYKLSTTPTLLLSAYRLQTFNYACTITLRLQLMIKGSLVPKKRVPGNTKGGSITVPLTSCLTGLESAV